jgi:hypothetical protein
MYDKLTPEQEASIPEYRDRWLKYGLDTSPVNEELAIEAIKLAYRLAGENEPDYFLFADGPLEAMRFLSAAPEVKLTEDDFNRLTAESTLSLTNEIRRITNELRIDKPEIVWPSSHGQHDTGWLGFYEFFDDHFGLAEKSRGLREIGKQCGAVWMYGRIAIISRKPIRVTMDNLGRLHNEKVAAVEYADGTKVYAFNGVALPEKWVLEKDTINPKEIISCQDADKRAAGIALYGYQRLKNALDYKILEGDPNTDIDALVEIAIPGLRNRGRFLEAICPRNGPVFLGVPQTNPWDDNKPITDAVGAQAFLARLPRSAYEHPAIRT